MPTRKSVAKNLGYDQDLLRSPLVAGVDYATSWQVGQYPDAIVNNFENQFVSALLGQQPLKQAMLRAQNEANIAVLIYVSYTRRGTACRALTPCDITLY